LRGTHDSLLSLDKFLQFPPGLIPRFRPFLSVLYIITSKGFEAAVSR